MDYNRYELRVIAIVTLIVGFVFLSVGCALIPPYSPPIRDLNSLNLPATPLLTISMQDKPIELVLEEISSVSGVEIESANDWWSGFPVTLEVEGLTLKETLLKLFGNLKYEIAVHREDGRINKLLIHAFLGE